MYSQLIKDACEYLDSTAILTEIHRGGGGRKKVGKEPENIDGSSL